MIDDRPERAGVKFRDIELTGVPHRLTVGRRGLAEGVVEHTVRATGETVGLPVDKAVAHLVSVLSG
ncbi:His/Gly/Thr/Pro-type tRNA ligase C-terminal domain-containing protein [Actinomadura harenae]|uniref:His/Gly/Thr/Pro-type tRNA ligase C-terminal domain-containing protein n=1 Tax=Actinomadura harenae TaxID=2483351 RepID=UPI0036102E46